ncbi:hypothetical protein RZN25_02730 [Bacillaceae bacterium S4-13-56]
MKEQMIIEMTAKLEEVQTAKEAVYTFVDEIEDKLAEGEKDVSALEQDLQAKQEVLSIITDIGEAKLAKQEIKLIVEEIELTNSVTEAKVKTMKVELENKIEEYFKIHKSAHFLFRAVDNYFVLNTSISSLAKDKETIDAFAQSLNGSFRGVRQVLLDIGIVTIADQNKQYRGTHLGQRDLMSELTNFEYEIRPYVNHLRSSGIYK